MAIITLLSYSKPDSPNGSTQVLFDKVSKEISFLYIDGAGGPEPAVGVHVYQDCDGTTLDRVRYDGFDQFSYDPEYNSTSCGVGGGSEFPADGMFIRTQCYGLDMFQVVADGNGGERKGNLVQANSTACGYVAPPPVPVPGCTNPAALNYNPAATEDDGSCVLPPAQYHAVGGVLPNPIEYTIPVDPMLNGEAKRNHFIKGTIHRSDNSLIGTMQARVRNGQATLDVSSYLRPVVGTELVTAASQVAEQPGAVEGFFLRYREMYNGMEGAEVTLAGQRKAVEAALDAYSGSLEPYVLRDGQEALPMFTTPYRQPVAFSGLPFEVSLLLDGSMAGRPMYFERRYLDHTGSELEILSTPVPASLAGKMVRFVLDAYPLPCAWKVELAIVDTDRSYFGSCPVAEGIKIFDHTFDFTFE